LRIAKFQPSLARIKDVLALVALAAMLSTVVSATIGVVSLSVGGVLPWHEFAALWRVWWLGDAVGNLIVAPLLLTWASIGRFHWQPERVAEGTVLAGGLTAVSILAFMGGLSELVQVPRHAPLEYTIFPFIIWAALRLGSAVTTLLIAIVSA